MSDFRALAWSSERIMGVLRAGVLADPMLQNLFTVQNFVVTSDSPKEMQSGNAPQQGISVWLYHLEREAFLTTRFPERIAADVVRRPPLPLQLHYLVTPVCQDSGTEQLLLGKVLEILSDRAILPPTPARVAKEETLHVTLEPIDLEATSRIWSALDAPYVLSVSYLACTVDIEAVETSLATPVIESLPSMAQVVTVP
ncbi:DUF4255 domain-containing protein [Mycolicibacterium sp. CR10]|uniref:DUF4255 domain-containing protein n=1 Tax=Mycolicibacterium sp. CR10 TaxID=2562314 RepID=UPI0010C13204|nr:DUF4255 domain-containing protein [Mycolicibacterium sp. CR10]